MLKSDAIAALGGSLSACAEAIGITTQAVSLWPDELPPRIADRVQAALWRRLRDGPNLVTADHPTEEAAK